MMQQVQCEISVKSRQSFRVCSTGHKECNPDATQSYYVYGPSEVQRLKNCQVNLSADMVMGKNIIPKHGEGQMIFLLGCSLYVSTDTNS